MEMWLMEMWLKHVITHATRNNYFPAQQHKRRICKRSSPIQIKQFLCQLLGGTMSSKAQTKKFQGGQRTVPHHLEKASKYYPAEEDRKPKAVRSINDSPDSR
jgi:hypothetical protein